MWWGIFVVWVCRCVGLYICLYLPELTLVATGATFPAGLNLLVPPALIVFLLLHVSRNVSNITTLPCSLPSIRMYSQDARTVSSSSHDCKSCRSHADGLVSHAPYAQMLLPESYAMLLQLPVRQLEDIFKVFHHLELRL